MTPDGAREVQRAAPTPPGDARTGMLDPGQRDRVSQAGRALRSFLTEHLAREGDQTDDPLLRSLACNRLLREELDDNDLRLVIALRRPGRAGGVVSWEAIGEAIGVSRQAAEKRWATKVATHFRNRAADLAALRAGSRPARPGPPSDAMPETPAQPGARLEAPPATEADATDRATARAA